MPAEGVPSPGVFRLEGARKSYAWGSPTALPELLGVPADGEPWAELWFGTHPGGAAWVIDDSVRTPLTDVLGGELPFLVKLLAVAGPLSLQVHPGEEQARAGFTREEGDGVPRDAPQRTYRDPAAKPEVIVAVSRFEALCGFRAVEETCAELDACGAAELAAVLAEHGHLAAVQWLLGERPPLRPKHPLFSRLDAAYPGDPGALVALLLNAVVLGPGEAVFLPAGQLHMYLDGLGVEVMGASDNVVRGGLTPKHVDTAELARILDPLPYRPPVLHPSAERWYDTPTSAFAVQQLAGPATWTAGGPEVIVCIDPGAGDLPAGSAAFVPAGMSASFGGRLAYRVTTGERARRAS